jgi:hypothetical protein
MTATPMFGVREYADGEGVKLDVNEHGRTVVVALNEGGYNRTEVDLLDLIDWLRANRPDLLAVRG